MSIQRLSIRVVLLAVVAVAGCRPGPAVVSTAENPETPFFEDVTAHSGIDFIYRNGEDIRYLDRMNTVLQDGDVVSILPAVAGG